MKPKDIAIVGMGCQFPKAPDLAAYWDNIRSARVCFSEIPKERWNHDLYYHPSPRETDKSYARKVGLLDDVRSFAAMHYGLAPLRVKVMDPQHRILLDAVRVALEDAGYGARPYPRENVGVFIGASVSEYKDLVTSRMRAQSLFDGLFGRVPETTPEIRAAVVEDVLPVRAFSIAGNLLNMMAATVAQTFDLGGPAFTIDAACSSSLVAVYEAILYLRAGLCDSAVAGGVYLNLTPDNLVGFSRIGAISKSDACRPFDAAADGFVLGEGCGVVYLKRLDDALAAGDRIYAVIRGAGINNDGRGEGPMTPRQEGQAAVLARAYGEVDFPTDTIGFVEAHGTATGVGDVVEVSALRGYYEAHKQGPIDAWISSVKANIGHTMSAAGVAGLIKAALVLHERTIPPQAAFDTPLPSLGLDGTAGFRVATAAQEWPAPADHPRRAAVSSFGFGGTNCHLVLEEAPLVERALAAVAVPREAPAPPEPFIVSAPTPALLSKHLESLANSLNEGAAARAPLAHLAYTLATRGREAAVAAFVARSKAELGEKLAAARALVAEAGDSATHRHGIWYSPAPACAGAKLALLFPGQGAQAIGLCEGLYDRYPRFRARLDALAAAIDDLLPRPLLTYLYPDRDGDFDPAAAAAALTRTEICQPAMAALGLALADLARSIGLSPSLTIGHSLGEFAALAAGGALSDEAALRLVAQRGRAMADLALDDPGAMAAIAADRATVEPHLAAHPGVVIANLNHPQQTVVSGTTDGVLALTARLSGAGLHVTRLQVSHAFHSPLVAAAGAAIAPLIDRLPLAAPHTPVISCIVPGEYPNDPAEMRKILQAHATASVNFAAGIERCAAAGATIFVQAGAGTALLSMARATLKSHAARPAAAVTLADTGSDDGARLAESLAELAALGLPLDITPLFDGARPVWLPPTPLETEPYWCIQRDDRNRPPLSLDSAPPQPAPNDALVALFREQMAVFQSQNEIIRQQTAALALTAPQPPVSVPISAPVAVPVPVPVPVAVAPAADAVEQKVVDIISSVSAFPRPNIKPDQRLISDLGFDSLMVVELSGKVSDTFPGIGGLPKSLFVHETTVGDIVRHLSGAIGERATAPAPALAAPAAITRYRALRVARPLAALPAGAELPFDGPVEILPDRLGVAPLLAARLAAAGRPATIVSAPNVAARSLIDLRGLDPVAGDPLADPALLRAPVERAFALARAAASPSCIAFATAGPAAAGVAGFAKALAREWPETRVKAPHFAALDDPAALAEQLFAELAGSDPTVEAIWSAGVRHTVELEPAPAPSGTLRDGAVILISGGARGLGARLALALARRHKARLALLGSRAPDAEVSDLISKIAAAGGQARYARADVRDAAQVEAAVQELRSTLGPIESVVHTAGAIADAPVAKKDPAAFARVFDTKVAGALALWGATARDPLATFLIYSSWSGRFGNATQTDYSAANHALAALAPALAATRPTVRVAALDLPPWDGTAMVETIPEPVRAMMRRSGVPFLDDASGLGHVLAELGATAAPSGELLLGADLPAAEREDATLVRLSLATHPYLGDHRVAGTPVLPLAAALDYAAGATARLASGPIAIRSFELTDGVRLAGEALWLHVRARSTGRGPIEIELSSSPSPSGKRTLAYRGRAEAFDGALPGLPAPTAVERPTLPLADFYARHTFHGPRMQGIVSIEDFGPSHIRGTVRASRPGDLLPTATFAADPLLVDSSFQLAGYWAFARHGRAGLPLGFAEWRPLAPIAPGAELHCHLVLDESKGDLFTGHIDYRDASGNLVAQLRGMQAALPSLRPEGEPSRRESGLPKVGATAVPSVELDPSTYQIEAFPEYQSLRQRLDLAQAMGIQNPYFNQHERVTADTTVIDGREMLNYSSYNYLGLSGDPAVNAAVDAAVARYGTSVSASRVASGEKPLHRELETSLARFLGTDDAIVMVGGHATNVSVIGHLFGPGDLILHDALAHDSILGGAKLSGARRRPFPHNDWSALDRTLTELRPHVKKVLIAIEGTYSMDGDIPALDQFIAVKKKHKCFLLVDEAHSLGVLGATGRGIGEQFAVERRDVDLWMGTLSKSLASCGGYIAGSKALVEYLKYTTPGFVYSVGISPPNAASAVAALRELEARPELVTTLRRRARFFLEVCRARGIDTGMSDGSAVIPCIVGNSWDCLQLAQALGRRAINVQPILYPAVEEQLARLRFFITAKHSEEQLRHTADVLAEELGKLNPAYLQRATAPAYPPASRGADVGQLP